MTEATGGRIRDLLSADDVGPDTRLILTNAVYFKAVWSHEFDAERTRERPFTLASGKAGEGDADQHRR